MKFTIALAAFSAIFAISAAVPTNTYQIAPRQLGGLGEAGAAPKKDPGAALAPRQLGEEGEAPPEDALGEVGAPSAADLAAVEAILAQARSERINAIQQAGGSGRVLLECGSLCSQCKAAAIAVAVLEIGSCGVAALAVEVLTAGTATILDIAGFFLCEGIATATLAEKEIQCAAIVDPV